MSESLAAVFRGTPNQLDLVRLPTPTPATGEILVRVLGCTLCGSDLHTLEGRRQTPTPTILGHEIVGQIMAIGDRSSARDSVGQLLKAGDRITWAIVANCGTCFYCQRGLPQKCSRAVKYGHQAFSPGRELLGGLAEHCLLVPGTSIVKLPKDLQLEVACPASCATATVAAALEAAGDVAGSTVGVLGAGLLGLKACAMARARGAAEVVCVETKSDRRSLAPKFGASAAVAPDELGSAARAVAGGEGLDIVLDFTGSNAAFERAWPLVRTGGTIVLVGAVFPAPPLCLHLEQVVRRHLTLRGIHNYAPRHLAQAVSFLAEHHARFPFAELVRQWHSLADIDRAVMAARQPGHIRVGIRPA